MNVLLDTCVVSEIHRSGGDARVKEYIAQLDDSTIFISVITLGEIMRGIQKLADGKRRRELSEWLSFIETHYADQILPIDLDVAHLWGELTARASANGRTVPASDGLIAATAMHHSLQVVTRNISDFEPTGVLLANPWAD